MAARSTLKKPVSKVSGSPPQTIKMLARVVIGQDGQYALLGYSDDPTKPADINDIDYNLVDFHGDFTPCEHFTIEIEIPFLSVRDVRYKFSGV